MAKKTKKLLLDTQILQREDEIRTRSKVFSHVSASLLAVLFVSLLAQFELDGLKGVLVDLLFRTQWWSNPHPEVRLVAYDDISSQRYEMSSRIPAEELAQVLEALVEEQPKAVGIIAPMSERYYTEAELALIGKSLGKLPQTYIGYTDDQSLGRPSPPSLGAGHFLPGFISRDTFSYGADSVSRRVMVTIDGLVTLYGMLACVSERKDCSNFQHDRRYEKLGTSLQTYINWQGRPGTYKAHSTADIAQRRFEKGTFTGKLILLGAHRHTQRDTDHIFTPFSRSEEGMPALEGAAHGLVTLLRGNGLTKTAPWINWVLSLCIGILTVNMVLHLSPGKGILFVVAEIVALFVAGWGMLFGLETWVNLAHPLVVACVGYYLVIPYRLVDEYRKRWHYQEKSELMVQLEQLKSNFLSLISHDLKTPIARIQGNAELALNEATGSTDKRRHYLEAIVHTTEDLGQYVETILDLTRIESAQVPIHKTTKDINATVQEVVESKRFLAAEKNITLVTELEPLFSIKFDVKLIRRVLSNLLENAIKYSPPDTTIKFSSREEGDWIRVSVSDEGVGIPATEQEKVFGKFYRCENEATKDTKGTGLGLYLVKYFVELHQGMVDLRSELGKGSTFTVSLPV